MKRNDEIAPIDKYEIKISNHNINIESQADKDAVVQQFWRRQRIRNGFEKIWKPILKLVKYVIVISFVLFVATLLSGIPRRVSWSAQGLMILAKDATDTGEQMDIKVDGWLSKRWFSRPKFKGEITLSAFDYTEQYNFSGIVFDKDEKGNMTGYMNWYMNVGGRRGLVSESLGIIWTDSKFKTMAILVFEPIGPTSKSTTDLCILSPANNVK